MFFTKRRINDKNGKSFQSNLTLYKPNQSTKSRIKTLRVNKELVGARATSMNSSLVIPTPYVDKATKLQRSLNYGPSFMFRGGLIT